LGPDHVITKYSYDNSQGTALVFFFFEIEPNLSIYQPSMASTKPSTVYGSASTATSSPSLRTVALVTGPIDAIFR
jgi:hypothetical protein